MPLHVAHFVHRYPPAVGGAEAYFARLGEYLTACGDSVDVWTTTAVELSEMWGQSVSREASPCAPALGEASRLTVKRFRPLTFPLRRYVLKALSFIPHRPWQLLTAPSNPVCPAMWREATRYDGPLDAVHATAFPYGFPLMCGLQLARRRKVPYLLTPFLHLGDPLDPHDRTRRQYTRPPLVWLLKQADRVFVQTPSEFELAKQLGVPELRLVLQGLGVESGECAGGDRAKARAAWGVTDDTFVIGHLTNNSVEKGTVDLLKSASVVAASLRAGTPHSQARGDDRVVLAGPAMPNFLQFWQSYPRKERVSRLGVLSDEQKRGFYAGIDAFCLPSKTDSFGLVLLEAWANGKPVVAYRAGGPADLIRDGIDGCLVRCGDVNELAMRLAELATDPERGRRMGEVGRERVVADFRWDDKLRLVRDTLVSLVGRS